MSLQDKTSMFTILTLVGPKAKDMMTEICETEVDMQPFTFRFFNMRFLFSLHSPHFFGLFFVMLSFFFFSYASGVMAVAITQTGEPGYSLYVPTESALHLYDKLMRIGVNYGIRNVGQLVYRCVCKYLDFQNNQSS